MRVIYCAENYLSVSDYDALQGPHEITIHHASVEAFEVTITISDPETGTFRKERLGTIAELRQLVAHAAEVKAVVDTANAAVEPVAYTKDTARG